MNTETKHTVIQAPPPQEPSFLDQIRNDHELVARLSITPQELEALSKCALLGTLTCKEDMLFILRQIRDARPGPKAQATHSSNPSTASTTSTASAPPLRAAEILRKIRLLSEVNTRNGASVAEADNAQRLARALMDRYSINMVEERPATQHRPAAKLTWVYWQELFNEFCLEFSYMGYRGSATIGHDRTVYVKLNTGRWSVEKRSKNGSGTQTVARDVGLDTLRKYLSAHARTYSFFGNRRSGS